MAIADRLTATGGKLTGFDYLPILLACAVIVVHSVGSGYGGAYATQVAGVLGIMQ